jgi:hypothetical protein
MSAAALSPSTSPSDPQEVKIKAPPKKPASDLECSVLLDDTSTLTRHWSEQKKEKIRMQQEHKKSDKKMSALSNHMKIQDK